jgi:hypothetical protein
MSLSMHTVLTQSVEHMLDNMSKLLDKAAAHAQHKGYDVAVLLNSRLAPDMFPLTRQVQIASDMAKSAAARLTASEMPKYEDTETTVDELKARIAKTLAYVRSVGAAGYEGSETREIVIPTRTRGDLRFNGQTYLLNFILPNFLFHVTTTYAILRHNGVELGKSDFIGG